MTERPGWIELRPPGKTSFAVTMYENGGTYTVYFDGWHEEMENEEEALNLFAMGLSDDVRLEVTCRGGTDHRWTVETRAGDQWQEGRIPRTRQSVEPLTSSVRPFIGARMEPVFEAVLKGGKELARLLRDDPGVARTRASRDYLVESIPHWLYVGDTSLHLAAAGLRMEVASVLLESGADPNAQNRRGATPLHYACDPRPSSGGTWDPATQALLIKALVEHGAEINLGDRGGATALHRAVRARSVAAVRQLLALGARTDCALKKGGSSPLHLAVQPTGAGGTAGVADQQLEIIDLLLQHGADRGAADAAGRTPRDWARSERVAKALQSRPAVRATE